MKNMKPIVTVEFIVIDALEFHHKNPSEKEFKLEAMKCILVCSNCHKEIHSKLGYIIGG